MRDPNDDIDAAIAAEERELLRQIDHEPNYFRQLGSVFRGDSAWVNVIMMIAQTALFIGGLYAGWQFYEATDPMTALHWGLPSVVMLITSLMIKLALWPVLQTNRVLLALKRLELRGATQR